VDLYGGRVAADAVQVTSEPPSAYGPEVTIRFFPDYSLKHPLWFWFGHPDLADLQLPADLADRLHRWSAYWDTTFHWDEGWPVGTPETWWAEEEEHLPRDIAMAFGSDFVIQVDGRYLHSTTDAGSPASATALHALINAEMDERQQIQNGIAAGDRYDAIAGDISYTAWLTQQQQDEDLGR
jgi:hypothetical protein